LPYASSIHLLAFTCAQTAVSVLAAFALFEGRDRIDVRATRDARSGCILVRMSMFGVKAVSVSFPHRPIKVGRQLAFVNAITVMALPSTACAEFTTLNRECTIAIQTDDLGKEAVHRKAAAQAALEEAGTETGDIRDFFSMAAADLSHSALAIFLIGSGPQEELNLMQDARDILNDCNGEKYRSAVRTRIAKEPQRMRSFAAARSPKAH
jgi:hypothetical protein